MTTEKHKSQRSESVLTPEARLAYIFAHEKRTKRGNGTPLATPRYDATILIPKLHADAGQCRNYEFLAKLCMEAATKAWGSWPQGGLWPIKDGDQPYVPKAKPGVAPKSPEEIAAANAWRRGNWVIEVTNFSDVGPRICVMQSGQAVEIPARVIAGRAMYKSGDYGLVSIHAYTFHNENFGVNIGFDGILFTREGEAIGSSGPKSAQQMFGSVAAFGQPAPQGYAPPGGPAAAPAPAAPQPQAPAPAASPQQYAPPPAAAVPQQYAPPPAAAAPAPMAPQGYAPSAPPPAPAPMAPQGYAPPAPPPAPAALPPFPTR